MYTWDRVIRQRHSDNLDVVPSSAQHFHRAKEIQGLKAGENQCGKCSHLPFILCDMGQSLDVDGAQTAIRFGMNATMNAFHANRSLNHINAMNAVFVAFPAKSFLI